MEYGKVVSFVLVLALVLGVVGGRELSAQTTTAFDDQNTGNWDASDADTWGTGQNGDYPGAEYSIGPPEVLDPDTALIDTGTVTANVTIPDEVVSTIQAGGTLYFTGLDQTCNIILDGGTFHQKGDNTGGENYMFGDVTVLQDSDHYMTGHGNSQNANTAFLNGDIKDGATTGRIHMSAGHANRLVLGGDNSGFSGGFLVDTPGSLAWNREGLRLASDAALGTGTTTLNTWMVVATHQTNSQQLPAPAKVIVNNGATLTCGSWNTAVAISGWEIDMDGGRLAFAGAYVSGRKQEFTGGNLYVTAADWELRKRWGEDGEYAGQIHGSGNVSVAYTGYDGRWGGGELILSGDNQNFTGNIDLAAQDGSLVTSLWADGANSLGMNNDIIVRGGANLHIRHPQALNDTNTLYLLAGSSGVLDLQDDATVYALNLGGEFVNDELVPDEDGWIAAGTYTGGPEFGDYVAFNGHELTVQFDPSFTPIPEPASLGLLGIGLLALRRRRA